MKKLVCVLLSVMMTISLVGCSSSKEASNGELNLFVWTEYVPESVIEGFEEETGIKVNVSTFSYQ
jgi:spermidine/putrescine transport system permease protein